jgi:tetratricopeptide (TPR) repeat protein
MRLSGSFTNLCVLALGFSCLVRPAPAQVRGGPIGGSTGGGLGSGTSPGNTSRVPTSPNSTTTDSRQTQPGGLQTNRAMFLSGKVMMDDGTAPPETVVIERICGGSRRPEGYTDSKGRFSFQLDQNRALVPDASENAVDMGGPMSAGGSGRGYGTTAAGGGTTARSSGTLGTDPRLMGCDLRAVLAGFRSDMVSLANRRVLDNPDVGTIILHRLGNVDGTTISATSLEAPKDAKKAYEKGLDAMKKEKWPEAQKSFDKAVESYPKYAAAWYELGEVCQKQNNPAEAQKAYQQSMQADPKYVKPYLPSAILLVQGQQWQQAAEMTDKLARLDPVDYPDALMYNAIANINLHKMDVAEKSAREAVRLDTEHRLPRAQYILGFILANKREYPEALTRMKSYVEMAPDAPDLDAIKKQIAELEKVTGQPGSAQAEPKQQ